MDDSRLFSSANLLSCLALTSLSLYGCVGSFEGGGRGDQGPTAEELAQAAFVERALPALQGGGCGGCHAQERNGAFMLGTEAEEIRQSLLAFSPSVINTTAPASSRVITKGDHSGPGLSPDSAADVLAWIELEQESTEASEDPEERAINEIPPFELSFCTAGEPGSATCPFNEVALDEVGAPGAILRFTAETLANGLYLSEISVLGGTSGAYVEHPIFVSWESEQEKVFDEFDRFFAAKVNAAPNEASLVGGGTAVFVQFASDKPLGIAFGLVEAYRPENGGGPAGGCKALDAFNANAKGPLQNNCVSCHGGGQANAQSAMNLAGLINDADVQTACNEVLLKSDKDNPNLSSIFVATDPGQGAAHPFNFGGNAGNHSNFVSAVSIWIQEEITAP